MRHCRRAFTLVELLVVLAIVGILMLVAVPTYQQQMRSVHRALASAELLSLLAGQEEFLAQNRQYASNLSLLGYEDPYAIDERGVRVGADSSARTYLLQMTIEEAFAYTLQAIPRLRQAADTRCATLSLSWTGEKSISGTGTVHRCW